MCFVANYTADYGGFFIIKIRSFMKRCHLKNIVGLSPCSMSILSNVLSYKFPIKKVPDYENLLLNVMPTERENVEFLSLDFNNRSGQYYIPDNMPYVSMQFLNKNKHYLGYVEPFYRGRNLSNETDENREIYREVYDALGGTKALLNYSDINWFVENLTGQLLRELFFRANYKKRVLLDTPKSHKYYRLFQYFDADDMVAFMFDEFIKKYKGYLLEVIGSFDTFFEVCNDNSMFRSGSALEDITTLSFTQDWSIKKYGLKLLVKDALLMLKAEDFRVKKLLGLVV
jgi:hypothetical protein